MSLVVASLMANIGANVSGFEQGSKKVKGGLTSLGSSFKQILPPGIAQFTSLSGAILAAGSAMKYAIDQAAESEMVDAKLNAVLESTGGAAGLAADELNKMAESLSKVSVYDDEAIKSSEALLLTFTNIGKNVFPEAEQAILDMSSALGQDLQSSTIQLGKALNDPIAGITALSRVGVSFTQQQKDMIKVLVESGDTLGAQKLILAELNKEFGGQAAAAANTYAGQMKQLNNEMGNLGEVIGQDLLPDMVFLVGSLKDGVEWTTKNYEALKKWGNTVLWVANPFMQLSKLAGKGLRGLFEDADESVDEFGVSAENAAGNVDGLSVALGDVTEPTHAAEDALKDYKDMLEEVSRANQDAESFMQSYADSQKQYASDHNEAVQGIVEAELKYTEAVKEHGKASKEALTALGDIDIAKEGVQALEAQWHESTQAMIYDMALAKVSMDGFTDAEFAAMQKVAVEKGIRTQEQADQAIRMMEEANAIAAGVAADEAVMREQSKQDAILSELEKQAELEKTGQIAVSGAEQSAQAQAVFTGVVDSATLSIIRQGEAAAKTAALVASIKYPSSGGGSTPPELIHSRDSGGPGIAGTPYMIGVPEIYAPKTGGEFIPLGGANAKSLGTVYNIVVNNPVKETAENSIRAALKNLNYIGEAA